MDDEGGDEGVALETHSAPATARRGEVWLLTDGKLVRVEVASGISDGTVTAVYGLSLQEGMQVVTGIVNDAAATQPATTSPLVPSFRGLGGAGGRAPGAGRASGT